MRRPNPRSCSVSHAMALAACVVLLTNAYPADVSAHEGHAALPTKGATVDGDQLLLSAGARKAIGLQLAKVTLADMKKTVTANARVEIPWSNHAFVTSLLPGRITEVLVRPGELVKAGQVLARLESLELESLQLEMLQAAAQAELHRRQYEQQEQLASDGVIAGKVLEETKAAWQHEVAQREIAVCKLLALGFSKGAIEQVRSSSEPIPTIDVTSPRQGTVAHADVRPGQIVKATDHLFNIVDLSKVWVVGDAPESSLADLKAGLPIKLRFPHLQGDALKGQIAHLRLAIEPQRRIREVIAVLDNSDGRLQSGMFGQMEIEVSKTKQAIVCPRNSVLRDAGGPFVLKRVGEGKYRRQHVEIGLETHTRAEIRDGLFPGDRVIVTGNHILASMFGGVENATQPNRANKHGKAKGEVPSLFIQGTIELPTASKAYGTSRIEGRVAHIHVMHGQKVTKGDVLAEIASLQLRTLQGELLASQTQLAWVSSRVQQMEKLERQNLGVKKELWKLQTERQNLTDEVGSIVRKLGQIGVSDEDIAKLRTVDLRESDCESALLQTVPIRAPQDGLIADIRLVPGQIVHAQDQAFEIHCPETVWIKGYVYQQDARRIHVGKDVEISFLAYPNIDRSGTVVRVAPPISSTKRIQPLWIEVENPDGKLIEGMLAEVRVPPDRPRDVAARSISQPPEAN